ncbi:MAG TPA: helix-turn-helix domain-containing protein [Xanthobacteraceae bacterium]|nr:helix-turn-helix domain-containing protein [Xanthobacteraceae bacterium]
MSRTAAVRPADRREEILDAAQRCFARAGFHQTSMQEICAEARMSPGGLYRYFASKEAIIAGIAERDRADVAEQFRIMREAPDFFQGLEMAARHYFVERPLDEVVVCAEIMSESRRSAEVDRIHTAIEADVKKGLIELLQEAAATGAVSKKIDFEATANILMAMGDGFAWRRAADKSFDAEAALPLAMTMIRAILADKESAQ